MKNNVQVRIPKGDIRNKINFKLWMAEIKWLNFKMGFESRVKRAILCKRGYHKIATGHEKYQNSKGLELETKYLRCVYCGLLLFPTERAKNHWERIHEASRQVFEKAINLSMKRRGIKGKAKIRKKKVKGF